MTLLRYAPTLSIHATSPYTISPKETILNLIDLAGTYQGDVCWSDSYGESGSLSEVIVLRPIGNGLLVDYEDGSGLRLDPVDAVRGLYTLRRDAVEVGGRAFLTDSSLVLDYATEVQDGVQEDIVDVWHRHNGAITRTGLIRQASRTIWFEAHMVRVD